MYTLFYSPGACSLAPHIALEEIGAPYELHLVAVSKEENRLPEYLAVNPKGLVPALRVEGIDETLTEGIAILTYLAASHPNAGLVPEDALRQARTYEWLSYLSGTVHAQGFGPLWRSDRLSSDTRIQEQLKLGARTRIERQYDYVERKLADDLERAASEGLDLADLYLFFLYLWGRHIALPMAKSYPSWTQRVAYLSKRPSVRRALAQEGLA